MQKFLFQITQEYVNKALKIISPYWVEIHYEVVDNEVTNLDARIPLEIAPYLIWGHLERDIYSAAENNALSMGSLKAQMSVFEILNGYFKPVIP